LLRQGLRVAIAGPTNAGKSSLLNALVGHSRAIVSDVAGTTRDTIEEAVDLHGLRVVLIDTAGLRHTSDVVERLGIDRTLAETAGADLVLYVYDASVGLQKSELPQVGQPALIVANKSDLRSGQPGLPVSALTGSGLPELICKILERAPDGDGVFYTNERQTAALRLAKDGLEEFLQALLGSAPADLLSVLLADTVDKLGRVSGETASAEILEEIFAHFCIGK